MKPGGELPLVEVDTWRREPYRKFDCALVETKQPERAHYETANRSLIKARCEMANQNFKSK